MARPRNQAARRAQLLAAASRRVADQGSVTLRFQDVADEAGLSPNTVRYYYNDLDQMLVEVHRLALDRFYQSRLRVIQQEHDPRRRLALTLASGIPENVEDRDWRLLEETAKIARSDDLYPILMSHLYHRQVALYTSILQAGTQAGLWKLTAELTTTAARALVALEDKLGLLIMWHDPAINPAVARDILYHYASLVTGTELTSFLPGTGKNPANGTAGGERPDLTVVKPRQARR